MKTINSIKNNIIVEDSLKTGQTDFDAWFSRNGGMVLGSAIYVSGTSGAGKTTLMANIMTWVKDVVSVIYSREMLSEHLLNQVKDLDFSNNANICDINDYKTFQDFMKEIWIIKPKILIIDSLQVIAKEDYVMNDICSEEKACYLIIKELREYTSQNNAVLFLIGHNTKDGEFAGVNTIMQMMDAHIDMVFDKKTGIRKMNWGVKNRKGPSDKSLEYSIENSKIVFKKEDDFLSEYRPYTELHEHLQEILENQKSLRCSPEQQKKVKKLLKSEILKNKKISRSDMELISKNIYSYLYILGKLQGGRI